MVHYFTTDHGLKLKPTFTNFKSQILFMGQVIFLDQGLKFSRKLNILQTDTDNLLSGRRKKYIKPITFL